MRNSYGRRSSVDSFQRRIVSTEQQKPIAAEPSKPTLRSDFSWTLVGNAVYAGGQFAILMLLAKLLLPEMVGQYALGLAIVYPVMMFTNLQLRQVMTSGSRKDVHFGNFLTLRALTTSSAFLLIFAIVRLFRYDWGLTEVVLLVGLAYGVETISEVYYARLQFHDNMAAIAKSLMARAILSVLFLATLTYFTRNVLWGVAGVAMARAIVLFAYDIREQTHGLERPANWFRRNASLAPRFEFKLQRELAWVSLPLGIVVLLGCLNASVPNFFIQHALGEREVGIFAAIGFMVSVGNMAVVSLGQSAFTRLARSYASGDFSMFASLVAKLLVFGAGIGVAGMVASKIAGREILTILFRREYAEHADLLIWIMAAGGVLYMAQFLGFALTAAGFYNSQVVLNILANASLFGACYWLVGRYGLLGAILAMLIGAFVQLAASGTILAMGMRKRVHPSAHKADQLESLTAVHVSTEGSPAFDGGD
jgi:O-antigen/teichoic acid export membrane protein